MLTRPKRLRVKSALAIAGVRAPGCQGQSGQPLPGDRAGRCARREPLRVDSPKAQPPPLCPPREACQSRARPGARRPPFSTHERYPNRTQVIVIPYSFAMKLRPLRRACLASASVNLGASGSESPMAPRKARNALETFPAAIISSKTGAAPRPAPSSVTAGSCRIAREIMAGFARRSSRPPTYRHCARARLPECQYAR